MKRNRLLYLFICGSLIVLGLCSRRFAGSLPHFIAEYAGDTLWAMTLFVAIGFFFARWPTRRVFILALLGSYAVEISQLYHAPWIDGIRANRLGGLVLGYGFLWSDIVCYTVGVSLGAWLETLMRKRGHRSNGI